MCAHTHTDTTACEISLDGWGRVGLGRPVTEQQARSRLRATQRHRPIRVDCRCACVDSPEARQHQDSGPTGGVTVTQSRAAAHGVRGGNFKVKPPAPLSQMGNGRERAGSGQDTGEMRVAAGRGPERPTAARAPKGPVFLKYTMFVSTCLSGYA